MDVWLVLFLDEGKGDRVLLEVLDDGLELVKLSTSCLVGCFRKDDDTNIRALWSAQ